MNEQEILKLKKDLEERKIELEEKIKKLESPVDFGSDVEGGEDMSEEADEAEEFGTNIALATELKKELVGVIEGLERIEKGEYGDCESCGCDHCH